MRLTARLVAAATLVGLAALPVQAATVAVTADRMIDVATGARVERPLVVITEGRITRVGRQGDSLPEGAERVDLPGVTLVPGLIDMHVHITSSPLYGGYNSLLFTDSFWPAIGVAHAKSTLEAGFTTIRNVGAEGYADVGLKQAIDAGFVPGPRIVPAAYALGATGGHCDSTFFPPSMSEQSPAVVDSPDEARRMVRKMRKYGAEVIKICATGGVFSRGSSPGAQQMTLEEMQAVVEEAHAAGMKVAAHAHGASGIRQALEAGVDTIEHVSLVDDEGIRLAVRKGAWFGMDIYNTDYTQAEGAKNGVLEENLQKDRDIGLIQRQNFQKALKAGVKMVYATDAGVYPHGDNARQFAVMVQWGASPLQALQSATLNAAEALGQAGQVGQIKTGAWADLVGVRGDPLSDVRVLEKPVFVMKGGQTVRKP
jgi:imidazolonepropionase-like amidohydrolase